MSARVGTLCAAMVALFVSAGRASAQTTVSLPAVTHGTVRAGSYANQKQGDLLATRSSTDGDYLRRSILKFDTQNGVPAGTNVSSALLTLTVKTGGADLSRRIAVYQVTQSFGDNDFTWNQRYVSQSTEWTSAGGDMATQLAVQTVSSSAGSKVTFDVTPLVKEAVSGSLGSSRYTRLELVDLDASTADSYREFYTPTDATTGNRPVMKVTYGSSSSSTSTGSTSSTSSSGSTLRVLQWNTHHGGIGTDGVWDVNRLMKWVAKIDPDIVSLNEVEYKDGYSKNQDDLALYLAELKSLTGKTWYGKFVVGSGASSGIGNAILSKIPFDASGHDYLTEGRAILNAAITVNGRTINFFSTHLDANSTSYRLTEIGELTSWAAGLAQERIISGDFNAWPGSSEHAKMAGDYRDSWAEAQSAGTAVAYAGNSAGNTRNSRIDYIWYSTSASHLVLKSSQVFDVRDANGVMPSDHRPVLSIFTVK
jgi:endonuclease/exonuclease/phosphatase family metal-dependent hydrolase